jgi:hypothetical protein
MRPTPAAPLVALALLLTALAGCSGPATFATRITIDFEGADRDAEAQVRLGEEDLASLPYFERANATHPGFPSAFDQLAAWSRDSGTPIDVRHGSFGFFLCGIGGAPGQGARAYWSLLVNGTPSPVGMQEARLGPGSHVTWRLEPSEFPNCPDPAPATPSGPGSEAGASRPPLLLDAPERVVAEGGSATVRGTVTPGALLGYRIGAQQRQVEVAPDGSWSFTVEVAPGRTEAVLTADDGAGTARRTVQLVRLVTAQVQAEFRGYPGHPDRDDSVRFDPDALASAPAYEGRDLRHPDGATVHDLMVEWSALTGVEVTYAYSNGLGYSVASIDGVGSPVQNGILSSTWCYSVNGDSADRGISTMPVVEGDVVTWRLGCA